MATGRHLEKWTWRHNSVEGSSILTKFGRPMQNGMPMTTHTSKSKPEIEFQYGDRPFSQTGSSFILAVDWDISSSKFGMQIEFHVLKQMPSLNLNPEVDSRLIRHLKNRYDVNSAADHPITAKSGTQMQNDYTYVKIETRSRISIWRPSVSVRFPKPEVVLSQPWIEISHRNLTCK